MQAASTRAATAACPTTDFKWARINSGPIATLRLIATLKPTHAN